MSKKDDKDKKTEYVGLEFRGDTLTHHANVAKRYNKDRSNPVATKGMAMDAKIWPTGLLSLDRIVGNGGLLGGRLVSAKGHEGTGKTMTAMSIGGAVQRAGGLVAFLDAEGTYSPEFSAACGMDPENLQLIGSTKDEILYGEDYFAYLKMLIRDKYNFIIVDSSAALVPRQTMAYQFGEGQQATTARLMSDELKKVVLELNASRNCVVYFINQIRMKPMQMFGEKEGQTGGEALKFYASYNFNIQKKGDIEKSILTPTGAFEKMVVGVKVALRIDKNKTARLPVEPIEFDVYTTFATDEDGIEYKPGIDAIKDSVEVGIATGVIKLGGSWYSYGGLRGNGKEEFTKQLRESNSEQAALRAEVLGQVARPTLTVVKDA